MKTKILFKLKQHVTGYNVFLLVSFLLVFFSILAPILLELGLVKPAKIIYFVYSFFCHQIHYRSLHIFDYQFAWCTRDTFIWTAMFVGGVLIKYIKVKPIKWYYLVLATIPMALDGGIQLVATMASMTENNSNVFYASTNFSRMLTGAILGLVLALWIFPILQEIGGIKATNKISSLKLFVVGMIISFIVYVGFIALWYMTSNSYKPANIIDLKNRFPDSNQEWLIRREHGVCPVDGQESNFLSFKCPEEKD